MTEIDDNLLKQFFSENKQEIADNGFTRRVMQSLPNRDTKIANILVSLCALASLILFVVSDGLLALVGVLREVFVSIVQNNAANFDLKTLLIISAVLLYLGVRKIYSME